LIFDERRARTMPAAPFAGYPPRVRRLFVWYDSLSDWQRVKYAGVAILFLLACAGYLLGLGSTMVLQRMEMDAVALAAAPLATALPTATFEPIAVVALAPASPTPTARPSATSVPATVLPTRTPFTAPQIAEPRAVPRNLPAQPAPVAPAARTPTPDPTRRRNLETSNPEPPASSVLTPTPGLARTRPNRRSRLRPCPPRPPPPLCHRLSARPRHRSRPKHRQSTSRVNRGHPTLRGPQRRTYVREVNHVLRRGSPLGMTPVYSGPCRRLRLGRRRPRPCHSLDVLKTRPRTT
jgi:hypothetical protein